MAKKFLDELIARFRTIGTDVWFYHDELRFVSPDKFLQGQLHRLSKMRLRKVILWVPPNPFYKSLPQKLELLQAKIAALPAKPFDLVGRECLGNSMINLIGVFEPERMGWIVDPHV
jgi:hypothetical protein